MMHHKKLLLLAAGLLTADLACAQGTEAALEAFFGTLFLCGFVIIAAAVVIIRYVWTRGRMARWVCGVAGAMFLALATWHGIRPDGNESSMIVAVGSITGFLCIVIAVAVSERIDSGAE